MVSARANNTLDKMYLKVSERGSIGVERYSTGIGVSIFLSEIVVSCGRSGGSSCTALSMIKSGFRRGKWQEISFLVR